ncbi:MAG: hypothetical protein A2365_00470 [Candidatus Nealsonbacteria bacterium RIFOXYB1_FULL_40_15]|uniref:Glycosyltransferase 2-like domain-containing protein n=2 Tax=Candidatus Nealsoniibacteriota TaxID=1817911 RepID=A0A1G2ESF8_9BACT|nr:MAG: hypothetical protein A2365_00470 [Candidatus Nealsonbacteria bacterium RIFOXYB1_FULL_40_15]OGZ28745.1 MAG: hypothetical protein A2427_01650 [Candidatus Nealsonbacteria bacterium RIFOXYC1_FULL_40_7]
MVFPKVSIIMGVYNELQEDLDATIRSVLEQTFSDFELIIIDDCSSETPVFPKDRRIIIIRNEKNLGLTRSLNKGIEKAKGKYIARIDARDIWKKEKLQKQIEFLEKNKDYIICGTQSFLIDKKGNVLGKTWFESEDLEIRKRLLLNRGIYLHSSIVFKNSGIKYREFFRYSQDLDLYFRLFFEGKCFCLKDSLMECQSEVSKISIEKKYYQRQYQNIARALFRQRIKSGRDDLDDGKTIRIKESRVGLFFCRISMIFYSKYIKNRIKKKPLWIFWLLVSFAFYPPLAKDYL